MRRNNPKGKNVTGNKRKRSQIDETVQESINEIIPVSQEDDKLSLKPSQKRKRFYYVVGENAYPLPKEASVRHNGLKTNGSKHFVTIPDHNITIEVHDKHTLQIRKNKPNFKDEYDMTWEKLLTLVTEVLSHDEVIPDYETDKQPNRDPKHYRFIHNNNVYHLPPQAVVKSKNRKKVKNNLFVTLPDSTIITVRSRQTVDQDIRLGILKPRMIYRDVMWYDIYKALGILPGSIFQTIDKQKMNAATMLMNEIHVAQAELRQEISTIEATESFMFFSNQQLQTENVVEPTFPAVDEETIKTAAVLMDEINASQASLKQEMSTVEADESFMLFPNQQLQTVNAVESTDGAMLNVNNQDIFRGNSNTLFCHPALNDSIYAAQPQQNLLSEQNVYVTNDGEDESYDLDFMSGKRS